MILVTGAAGKTGRAVVKALAAQGEAIRALVSRKGQISLLEKLGAKEVVIADMLEYGQVDEATKGTQKVYLICPNMHPEEIRIGENVMKSAQTHGCKHIVYHSVLHPQIEAMPHHWLKLRVEEKLFESGIPFTVVQPGAYMQNILASWNSILDRGVYSVPYAARTQVSMVDLDDIAEVGVKVLTQAGHEGAIYELSGPEALSQEDVAAIIAQQLGRSIRLEVVSRQEWKEQARTRGLGEYEIATLVKMFGYYERYNFTGNPKVLEWLLGGKATHLAEFVDRIKQEGV